MREQETFMYTLRFDGLYRGVPGSVKAANKAGFLCVGWLISRDGVVVAKGHAVFAHSRDATSNVAEYLALIEGLESLRDMGVRDEPVEVMGDAKTVIEQVQGLADVNAARIKPVWRRAKKAAGYFGNLTWRWTPRRHNHAADQLTRHALHAMRFDRQGYEEALRAIAPGGRSHQPRAGQFLSLIDLRIYYPAGIPAN
jgi:ribonuclease HI